jgi:hypothetical protein
MSNFQLEKRYIIECIKSKVRAERSEKNEANSQITPIEELLFVQLWRAEATILQRLSNLSPATINAVIVNLSEKLKLIKDDRETTTTSLTGPLFHVFVREAQLNQNAIEVMEVLNELTKIRFDKILITE